MVLVGYKANSLKLVKNKFFNISLNTHVLGKGQNRLIWLRLSQMKYQQY